MTELRITATDASTVFTGAARALLDEAKALVAAMPITADEAASKETRDAFTGGEDKTARQAELEQKWAAFATEKYAAAKAKADEALNLVD